MKLRLILNLPDALLFAILDQRRAQIYPETRPFTSIADAVEFIQSKCESLPGCSFEVISYGDENAN